MTRSKSEDITEWQRFELDVAGLLHLQGYEVKLDRIVCERQTDVISTLSHTTCTTKVLVECKYHRLRISVGVRDVTDFCSRVHNGRISGRVDKGLLVTNTRFTPRAYAYVEEHGLDEHVSLLTYDDLQRSLIDLSDYCQRLMLEFQASDLSKYMVDLKCAYLDGKVHNSLKQSVLHWLGRDDSPQLCILGDYGSGKTSFCSSLAAYLADLYLRDPKPNRIPVLIPLHEYARAGAVKPMISDWLVNDACVRNPSYRSFMHLLQNGRFVVILDGFDEMTKRTDLQLVHDNFRNLATLYKEQSKLIITGRPGYFPDIEEMNRLIHGFASTLERSRVAVMQWAVKNADPYVVLSLKPLTQRQIKHIVEARQELLCTNDRTPEEFLAILNSKYNMADLARRPVLLDIMIRTYAEFGAEMSAVNTASLYELYVGLWIDRDRDKGDFRRLVSPDDKRLFMQEIAWKMVTDGIFKIHYTEIPSTVENHFRRSQFTFNDTYRDSHAFVDNYSHDIMTCSFLIRNDVGYYSFAHKSFMEFFAALKLFREIGKSYTSMIQGLISEEVADFLAELIVDHGIITELLLDIVYEGRVKTNKEPGRIRGLAHAFIVGASNAITVLSRIEGAMKGIDLTSVNLNGASLAKYTELTGAIFDNTCFNNVDLPECDITNASASNVSWANIRCSRTDASELNLQDSSLAFSSFDSARLCEARLINTTLKNCRFSGANMKGVLFRECKTKGLVCRNTNLSGAEFIKCDLTGVDLEESDLTGARFDHCILKKGNLRFTKRHECKFIECDMSKCEFEPSE